MFAVTESRRVALGAASSMSSSSAPVEHRVRAAEHEPSHQDDLDGSRDAARQRPLLLAAGELQGRRPRRSFASSHKRRLAQAGLDARPCHSPDRSRRGCAGRTRTVVEESLRTGFGSGTACRPLPGRSTIHAGGGRGLLNVRVTRPLDLHVGSPFRDPGLTDLMSVDLPHPDGR